MYTYNACLFTSFGNCHVIFTKINALYILIDTIIPSDNTTYSIVCATNKINNVVRGRGGGGANECYERLSFLATSFSSCKTAVSCSPSYRWQLHCIRHSDKFDVASVIPNGKLLFSIVSC